MLCARALRSAHTAWSAVTRALSTAGPASPGPQLVRDFIHESLYHPEHGYFSRGPSVGTPAAPIDFPSLGNDIAYFNHVQALYTALQVSWLTPVEILQPHYGAALAAFLAARWRAAGTPGPLQIYEIGGGTGTLALNVLDYLRQHHPDLYATTQYTSIEISGSLAETQAKRLRADLGHAQRWAVERRDATDRAGWGSGIRQASPCFVVAMEVLDNLPHDLVVRRGAGVWQQVAVASESIGMDSGQANTERGDSMAAASRAAPAQPSATGAGEVNAGDRSSDGAVTAANTTLEAAEETASPPSTASSSSAPTQPQPKKGGQQQANEAVFTEIEQPLTDELILRALRGAESTPGSIPAPGLLRRGLAGLSPRLAPRQSLFLPTGALRLMDTLHAVLPRHALIAADFDQLPEVVIRGKNAPLVATTEKGVTRDHGSYLVPMGTADIFFPSDFPLLRALHAESGERARTSRAPGGARVAPLARPGSAGPAQAAPTQSPASAGHWCKSGRFLRRWAEQGATRTKSGYEPLVSDYTNTCFLVAGCPELCAAPPCD